MHNQLEQKQQTKLTSVNAPAAAKNFSACKECGDSDADTRSGAAICRRCGDAHLAQVAFTD